MAKRAPKADPPDLLLAASAGASPSPVVGRLEQVLGQPAALSVLRGAIDSGRLHHAWIFHGPVGVGKFTTARAFAARMLAQVGGAPNLQHPDLHVVAKELAAQSSDPDVRKRKQLNIPVEVLREFLLAPAALARTVQSDSLAGKVFIIDQADLMALPGQNAILKTLEEPPDGTVIILVTADEDRLLPTIRSRCQRVAFFPLPPADMASWAKAGLPDTLPKSQREWVVAYAAGSPGAAHEAVTHGLHTWHEALEPLLARLDQGQFPGELASTMTKLVDERAADAVKGAAEASQEAANRFWSKLMLSYLARRWAAALRRPNADTQAALRSIERLSEAERALDANVRFADVFEDLVAGVGV